MATKTKTKSKREGHSWSKMLPLIGGGKAHHVLINAVVSGDVVKQ